MAPCPDLVFLKLKASCYVNKPVMFKKFIETIKAVDEFWLTVVKRPPQAT